MDQIAYNKDGQRSPSPNRASSPVQDTASKAASYQDTAAVVIDTGTGFTKAGFSGDEKPMITIETRVGVPRIRGRDQKQEVPDYYIGTNIPRGHVDVEERKTLSHGVVIDWDALEMLWHHIFYSELHVCPEEYAVLIADAPLSPITNREKVVELLFENFSVPAMHISHQSLLSMYSYGRTSGLVIECGSGSSYSAPIHNGYTLPHATYRLDLAGISLTEYMGKLMAECGNPFSEDEKDVVREIKERVCYISQDCNAELHDDERKYLLDYTLPDNQVITIGSERFRCPEALFNPSAVGMSLAGIQVQAMNSIMKCKEDFHQELLDNILICGGSSLIKGFSERIKKELMKSSPNGAKVNIMASPHRKFSAWLGGSIITCLNSFEPLWVTREMFDENGPSIVHRKCF
ncbi:actin-3-like [Latimeria chalumnae]|uniref:actin-3-like n=1 Tax=Latimeria chalumnae TaxID=7897 RepID=UPI00313D21B7